MRILACGDVVGRSGRKVFVDNIADLRRRLALDFVVVNGENAAHGFGITEQICKSFYEAGADAITSGNHVWNRREILSFLDSDSRLLRPMNYPDGTPGRGKGVFTTAKGGKVLVVNPIGRLFMDPLDDPFAAVETELTRHRLGVTVDCIIVDIHAEATSEKMAMGHKLDGRVSVVVGSHTHVPTADTMILPGGTAYQTDMGMCGDFDSVIGMVKETAVARFTSQLPMQRLQPSTGEATLCALFVETDDKTGLARHVAPLRLGGCLPEQWPL